MKKVLNIFVIVVLICVAIHSNVNYFYFNRRIKNLEENLKTEQIENKGLKEDIKTIKVLTTKLISIDKKFENIEVEEINCIEYLIEVAVVANDYLEYSKAMFDCGKNFTDRISKYRPVSVKEISNIETELDKKDRKIFNLTKKYDDLKEEYKELSKTLYLLTKN